jgi:hypothetical protein
MSESDGSGRREQARRDLNSRLLHSAQRHKDGRTAGVGNDRLRSWQSDRLFSLLLPSSIDSFPAPVQPQKGIIASRENMI